ncbi:MAG: phosphodiesterase [Porticoccaceae bacterium]
MSLSSRDNHVTRVIQLSDCHLGAGEQFVLAGINTARSLSRVLDDLGEQLASCDLLAVTGDIAADGEREAYQLFDKLLAGRAPAMAGLPGNHDDFALMQRVLRQPFLRVVELNGWTLVFLVSAVPGKVWGQLAEAELAQLDALLSTCRDRHVALFVHHPPAEIQCRWLDRQRIANADALAELVARHGQIKVIFSGHVHQSCAVDWAGIPVYTVPSTCFQFAPACDEFELCGQPPGYRWINFHDNGAVETGVVFVREGHQAVDQHCIGY